MSKTTTPTTRGSNSLEPDVPSAPPEPHQQAAIALRAQTDDTDLQYLPLRGLRLDERNVRKDPPTEAEIEELADLIDAQGLLQNLTVLAYDSPKRGKGREKNRTFTHGVIAGGRRLRALHVLVRRGRITLDYEVLCAVVPAERAIAVSMAENQGQKPMSIADTVQAFADMVTAGAGIEDIAVCFGLTPLTVKRRLKLASASPKLFALYRAGNMNMDQLMALSLAETHEKQESAWEGMPVYNRSPGALRRLILGEGVRSSLVRFVGLEAYEQAGGHVIRDLFSSEQGEAEHIGDPELMQRLALDKLKGHAEDERTRAGWAWVEVAFEYDYEVAQRYCKAPTLRREPSAEQAHALGELEREKDEVDQRIEALYDADDCDGDTTDDIEALEGRSDALQMRIDAIEAQLAHCAPEVVAMDGAVLTLAEDGSVVVKAHLLHKEDAKALRAGAAMPAGRAGFDDADEDGEPGKAANAANGGLSAALCQELTAYRTEALQLALFRRPQVALAALAHAMSTMLLYDSMTAHFESPSALGVSVKSCSWSLLQLAPGLADSPAHKSLQSGVEAWRARLPSDPKALLPFLLEQPTEVLVDLLVLCTSLTTHGLHGTAHAKPARVLATATSLNMADWWEASGSTYLGRVPKALIIQAVDEAGVGDAAAGLTKLKKAEAVSQAEALLAGKRWLPELLRVEA